MEKALLVSIAPAPSEAPEQHRGRALARILWEFGMTTPIVLTFIGHDRPGLVNAISEKVAASGGTWLESRLAHLAGEFAGILLVSVPDSKIAALTAALRDLETAGLRITIERSADTQTHEKIHKTSSWSSSAMTAPASSAK